MKGITMWAKFIYIMALVWPIQVDGPDHTHACRRAIPRPCHAGTSTCMRVHSYSYVVMAYLVMAYIVMAYTVMSNGDRACCWRPNHIGHNYVDHNYIGHNYVDHNYVGHNYVGHNYVGHNFVCHNHNCAPLGAFPNRLPLPSAIALYLMTIIGHNYYRP